METNRQVHVRIIVGDQQFGATLEDSAATRAFTAQLPLELALRDYNQTEKITDLPKRLPTDDSSDGIAPAVGDIAYFVPWGNLAIFYRDFDYSRGLIRLGKLDSGIEEFAKLANGSIRIERVR